MDMDHPPTEEDGEKLETDEKEVPEEKKQKKKNKKEEERHFEILVNLSRVIPSQLKYISFPEGSRYIPVKKVRSDCIVLTTAYWWCFDHEGFETT
jgi:26S proteasome regulatory subunit N2